MTEATRKRCEEIISRYPEDWRQAAILPVLHTVQKEWGYIPLEGIEMVAGMLGMPPARAAGVMSFYPMFHKAPVGRHVVQICATLSCALGGAKDLVDHIKRTYRIEVEGTTEDGKFTFEKAECIAACEGAPAIRIDETLYRNITPEKFDELIAALD